MIKNLIYDVGMHNGDDTAYYLRKGYDVIAIEADPCLAEQGEQRFSDFIKKGRLQIINCGITENDGTAEFFVNETNSVWNSFYEEIASRDNLPYHKIKVTCTQFENILKKYGVPFYLKIDIEGNDMLCVEALDPDDLPYYLSVEASSVEQLFKLKNIGYKKFQCINQYSLLPLTLSNHAHKKLSFKKNIEERSLPSRILSRLWKRKTYRAASKPIENKDNLSIFPIGSSGPFGADLEGLWMSCEEVKNLWLAALNLYESNKNNPSYGFWCDFHACKDR